MKMIQNNYGVILEEGINQAPVYLEGQRPNERSNERLMNSLNLLLNNIWVKAFLISFKVAIIGFAMWFILYNFTSAINEEKQSYFGMPFSISLLTTIIYLTINFQHDVLNILNYFYYGVSLTVLWIFNFYSREPMHDFSGDSNIIELFLYLIMSLETYIFLTR